MPKGIYKRKPRKISRPRKAKALKLGKIYAVRAEPDLPGRKRKLEGMVTMEDHNRRIAQEQTNAEIAVARMKSEPNKLIEDHALREFVKGVEGMSPAILPTMMFVVATGVGQGQVKFSMFSADVIKLVGQFVKSHL